MKRSMLILLLVLLVTLSGCSFLGGSSTTPTETAAQSATETTPSASGTDQGTETATASERPQVSVTDGQLETALSEYARQRSAASDRTFETARIDD